MSNATVLRPTRCDRPPAVSARARLATAQRDSQARARFGQRRSPTGIFSELRLCTSGSRRSSKSSNIGSRQRGSTPWRIALWHWAGRVRRWK